ncbi:hypothetical protein QBC36DRAFT_137447 [Triangularia setosa]|uniref:Uncharacterized protein n=1 Tax=Triangularia setosa TaxID=2587417 RepID=A0AAN6WFD1_9PEZI|nr:hypothetical protein QBC36DRAFT_137447 [Podospora setosa]
MRHGASASSWPSPPSSPFYDINGQYFCQLRAHPIQTSIFFPPTSLYCCPTSAFAAPKYLFLSVQKKKKTLRVHATSMYDSHISQSCWLLLLPDRFYLQWIAMSVCSTPSCFLSCLAATLPVKREARSNSTMPPTSLHIPFGFVELRGMTRRYSAINQLGKYADRRQYLARSVSSAVPSVPFYFQNGGVDLSFPCCFPSATDLAKSHECSCG